MGWYSAVLLMVATACVTLSAIHAHVWLRERKLASNGAFAALAACVALMAFAELRMVNAQTPEEYGLALWWNHVPVWAGFLSATMFVRLHLRAGRTWLALTAVGLRTLALVINFFSSPNINFSEITSLDHVTLLGEQVAFGRGTPGTSLIVAHAALVVLVLFVTDAAWSTWRQGERRRALTVGVSFVVFVSAATSMAILSVWGLAKVPLLGTMFFLPIVIAMGYELSLDILNSVRLASQLEAKSVELRGSERKLAFAAEAARVGLWSIEPGSGRLWATPQALAMFGLAPDREHRVSEVLEVVHPEDREQVREFVTRPPGSEQGSVEYRVVLPGGAVRWLGSRGAEHEEGSERRMMGLTVDITDRKRTEEEAVRQRIELEHLSRVATVSELSGALAHELNQPLAIIMSNAEAAQLLLERPSPDLDEIRAILKDIVDADARAGEVIRRLRGMLKRSAPQRQPLSLNGLLQEVLQFMRTDLVRRGIAVETSFADGLQHVSADRVPIEQVLINVITNACDAMAANAAGDRTLKVATSADSTMACVRFEDVGSGLPAIPERVFDAFYTTKREGLGMGLAISRSIIAAHGGRLSAEPSAPRGAGFIVCLPLATEPA